MIRATAAAGLLLVAVVSCTAKGEPQSPPTPTSTSPAPSPSPDPSAADAFHVSSVAEIVQALAGEIGPREATSEAYRRASGVVEQRLRALGYTVRRQSFHVPAGSSIGVRVPAGVTFNVIAESPGFSAARPYFVVGAHLDTVPMAPGAVDNAAGVGMVLELARLAAVRAPPAQLVFVLFGAEESRGSRGLYGSEQFVTTLDGTARGSLTGALVIDRIGVGKRVRVCTGSPLAKVLSDGFLDAARRANVPAVACDNRSSDHVPFERIGAPAVRIGADPFPEYHTPKDVPAVMDPAQITRAGTLAWEALRALGRS